MTLPFALGDIPLPDWMPGWVPVVLLIPAVVWLLMALAMPFAILGTRSRLEGIESQLDDLHAELRGLTARLGPPLEAPLPDRLRPEPRARRVPGSREEPRVGWPRPADD